MTFLYLIIITAGSSADHVRRFSFDNYAACATALKELRIDNKKETTVTAFCANEKNQRNYNATWWTDSQKNSN